VSEIPAHKPSPDPLPPATFELAQRADAIVFDAASGFEYEMLPRGKRPGDGLLPLRKALTSTATSGVLVDPLGGRAKDRCAKQVFWQVPLEPDRRWDKR